MYDRSIEGKDLTFQVSGMLWQRSLIMRDLDTQTLWSHLLGKGMRGEHEGVALEMLPATMTNWKDWKARHPSTTLLAMSRTSRRYLDKAWKTPANFVFGINNRATNSAIAVSLLKLQQDHVVQIGETVVTHLPDGGSIQAFNSIVDEQILTFSFSKPGEMIDQPTGTIWNATNGAAISGKLAGKQLTPVPGTISFTNAWASFYPASKWVR